MGDVPESCDWNRTRAGVSMSLLQVATLDRPFRLSPFLDHDFAPKIADFGLAKLCHLKDSVPSMAEARGTIGFIAPEVFRSEERRVGKECRL